MKKFLAILITILICNCAFAEEKTYYAQKGNYYVLFCPEKLTSYNIHSTGPLSYSMNSDLMNSKSLITFFIQGDGEITVKMETSKEEHTYKIISGTDTPENCDDKFYRLDVDTPQLPTGRMKR